MGAIKLAHTVSLNDRKLRYESLFTDDTTSWQTGDAEHQLSSDALDVYVQAFNIADRVSQAPLHEICEQRVSRNTLFAYVLAPLQDLLEISVR